jgi:hypothetical protein
MFENENQANFAGETEVDALTKAMQAGGITGRETTGLKLTVEPLKLESLEPMLKILEFRMQDIKLWNEVPKQTAYNTVEEAVQLQSFGLDRGGFYNEGERPEFEDSIYVRISQNPKYIQVGGEVTLQAQLVKTMLTQSTYAQEVQNKMQWVLRKTNTALTKADAGIITQEFNGFFKQHQHVGQSGDFTYTSVDQYFTSNAVVDLRGKSLTQYDVEQAAVKLDQNYAGVSHLFSTPQVISTLTQDYFKDQRILQSAQAAVTGTIGTVAKAIGTSFGDVKLMGDKFMSHDKIKSIADNATHVKAPAAPVADGTTPTAVTADIFSKFTASEAGTVWYAVSALNRFGESNLTVLGAAKVTIAVGSSVDLKFAPGTGANAAAGFVIYRTLLTTASSASGLDFFPVMKVSASDLTNGNNQGASAGVIRDRGYIMPNTEQGFMTEMVEEVLSFKQLAPLSKVELARTALSTPFVIFLYGTPFLYAPKKMIRFINAGKTYNH